MNLLDLFENHDQQRVTEALGLYGPFTATINTGERPQSRTKTKKFRREDDAILWAQDWLEDFPQYSFATAEVTDPEGNVLWTTDESLDEQGVPEAMKPSDIPPAMRQRLTMRDIEAERPQGAYRFRVTYPDGSHRDFMDFAAARSAADIEKGRISRLGEDRKIASTGRTERVLKQLRAQYPEAANDMEALLLSFRSGQLQDRRDINRLDTELDSEEAAIDRLEAEIERIKKRRMASEGLRDREYHVATVTLDDGSVKRIPVTQDEGFREMIEKYFAQRGRKVQDVKMDYAVQTEAAKKKPQPTNPELWGRAKSAARSKFDVYPSAYANAWAAKWYKQHGGGWRMGKPKKKD